MQYVCDVIKGDVISCEKHLMTAQQDAIVLRR
jgi:hypothetical protein